MKGQIIILTLLGFVTGLSLNAQSVNNQCDTIFDFVETMPKYEDDVKGLMDFVISDLSPILSACYKRDSILTSSISLTLTIDSQGKVIDVEFQRIQASEECKKELRQKLFSMTGWISGKQNEIPICSKYAWPMNINWK